MPGPGNISVHSFTDLNCNLVDPKIIIFLKISERLKELNILNNNNKNKKELENKNL